MKYLHFILIFSLFLISCQNRNQVTHNKRKYRKGYYKPSRAKVKHKKSGKEEEYANKNESTQSENKRPKTKVEHSVVTTQKADENVEAGNNSSKKNRNISSYPEYVAGKDGAQHENEKKNIIRKTHKNSSESQDGQNEQEEEVPKKTNWMYWLSLAFILLGIIAFCIGLVLLFVSIWLTAIVLSVFFFMVIFGMLIIFSLMLGLALLLIFAYAFALY